MRQLSTTDVIQKRPVAACQKWKLKNHNAGQSQHSLPDRSNQRSPCAPAFARMPIFVRSEIRARVVGSAIRSFIFRLMAARLSGVHLVLRRDVRPLIDCSRVRKQHKPRDRRHVPWRTRRAAGRADRRRRMSSVRAGCSGRPKRDRRRSSIPADRIWLKRVRSSRHRWCSELIRKEFWRVRPNVLIFLRSNT